MAHWSQSLEAAQELIDEYDRVLNEWRVLKADDPPAAFAFKREALEPLAFDVRRSTQHWRAIGEALLVLDPDHPGARQFVRIEDNVGTPTVDDQVKITEDGAA